MFQANVLCPCEVTGADEKTKDKELDSGHNACGCGVVKLKEALPRAPRLRYSAGAGVPAAALLSKPETSANQVVASNG
jgi:hypothetical protein